MARQPGEVFDTADEYDRRIQGVVPDYARLHEALLFAARTLRPEPQSILEIGVGTGTLTEHLLDAFPDAYLVGIDSSERMLGFADRRLATERVRLIPGDMLDLPEALGFDGSPASFNLVVSAFAIHHLDLSAKRRLAEAVHGLLDDGGVFLNVDRLRAAGGKEELLDEAHFSHHMLQAGYTPEEVLERRFDREEMDQPDTVEAQVNALVDAGFDEAFLACRSFGNGLLVGVKVPGGGA